jgi:hypothetical protein
MPTSQLPACLTLHATCLLDAVRHLSVACCTPPVWRMMHATLQAADRAWRPRSALQHQPRRRRQRRHDSGTGPFGPKAGSQSAACQNRPVRSPAYARSLLVLAQHSLSVLMPCARSLSADAIRPRVLQPHESRCGHVRSVPTTAPRHRSELAVAQPAQACGGALPSAQADGLHRLAGWHAEFYIDAALLAEQAYARTLTRARTHAHPRARRHMRLLATLPVVAVDHVGLSAAGQPHLRALLERRHRMRHIAREAVERWSRNAMPGLLQCIPACSRIRIATPWDATIAAGAPRRCRRSSS